MEDEVETHVRLGTLAGIIPAVALPMTPDEEPDLPAYRAYLRWIVGQGPVALAVNADTGEGPTLTPDERRTVLEATLDEVGDRIPVIAGLAGPSTRAARVTAREAAAAGAAGLLVFPVGAYLGEPLPAEVPYAYHAAVADATDLPLILFQLQPSLGGVLFAPDTLARLVDIPSVAAIKEASFDAIRFVELRDLLATLRPIDLLTGNDNFILESFVLGATGALIGMSAIATRAQVEMVKAELAGDHESAQAQYEELLPLIRAVFAAPVRNYRARVKEGLVMQGVIPHATVRAPLLPIPESERRAVRDGLARLGLVAGVPA
ncbi:MAG TPA: dihydrodipicolinate synthase family protein [Candidatus Limnocylindrales bacterium]|nr:dihydrodipicolinate synthase family protein [Candidatus Limnocylindrales bacterium]